MQNEQNTQPGAAARPITREDVEAFICARLADIQLHLPNYGTLILEVGRHIHDGVPAAFDLEWRAYVHGAGTVLTPGNGRRTLEGIMAEVDRLAAENRPANRAAKLREQARALEAAAAAIEHREGAR